MKAIYPDTPANQALIRAVLVRDVGGVRQALQEGADVNTTHRKHNSALLLAVLGGDQGCPAIIALLLASGAPLFHVAHKQGRTPIDEAIRQGRWKAYKVFEDAVGGPHGFLREDTFVQGQMLDNLMYGAMHCRQMHRAFLALMRQAQDDLSIRRSARTISPAMGWPWDNLVGMWRHDASVLEAIEQLYPFPNREQVDKANWMKFMCAAAHGGTESVVLSRIVDNTPATWWTEPAIDALPDPKNYSRWMPPRARLPYPTTVLEYFLAEGHRKGTVLALKRIAKDAQALVSVQPQLNGLLEWAALQGSRPLMLALSKLRAGGEKTPQAVLDAMLRQTLNKEYDSHHRLGLMRSLLARGANPNNVDEQGDSAMHLAVEWEPKHRLEDIINLLVEYKGQWTTLDADGLTPLDKLQAHQPKLAASKRQHLLNHSWTLPVAGQGTGRARL